jgi:hydrogenase nickel incorporation protein HypA/HybF
MHELTIAQNILEIAEETLAKSEFSRVVKVVIDLGELSGVDEQALLFALECLTPKTVLENAGIEVNRIEARMKCRECFLEFRPSEIFDICPHCGSPAPDIVSGKELSVKSLGVE